MTTETLTLADFLLARISEDEAVAAGWPNDQPGLAPDGQLWRDARGHFIYQARTRVMAECEAKRRIVELHRAERGVFDHVGCAICFETMVGAENTSLGTDYVRMEDWPCETLRALALPYADHPDYRDEWKP